MVHGQPNRCRWQRQKGSTIAESVIGMVIVLMIGFGAAQWALIYHAKTLLDYAALQGARAGAVRNAEPGAITAGVARALLPLYLPEADVASADAALTNRVVPDLQRFGELRILNPTREAFVDHGRTQNGVRFIPNAYLTARSSATGDRSGINIQDANLLKIEVTYGYELNVPLVGRMITQGLQLPFIGNVMTPRAGYDDAERTMLEAGRLPIVASATVRMQSPAHRNNHMVNRGDLARPE